MNKKELLEYLSELLGDYYCHPKFLRELKDVLHKNLSGKENQFFKILYQQLVNINNLKRMIYQADSHEVLKHASRPYFSIHLQNSQFNVRMLIHITADGVPLFLAVFYERQGKRATDYSQWISVLDQRLMEMLGDGNNE